MKKRHPEFLIWFGIVTVLHFLIYWLLALGAIIANPGLFLPVLVLCAKGLSFPLGWFLHSGENQQLSAWMHFAVGVFNSVIWGAVIASIISVVKERRSKLDAL